MRERRLDGMLGGLYEAWNLGISSHPIVIQSWAEPPPMQLSYKSHDCLCFWRTPILARQPVLSF
jgi:hypothetical protein